MQRILSSLRAIVLPKMLTTTEAFNTAHRCFSNLQNSLMKPNLLSANTPLITSVCNFKVKGHLRRRCKSCYFVVRDERLYVICPKFPRHKRMAMKPKPHNTWILTHASQSRIRPW